MEGKLYIGTYTREKSEGIYLYDFKRRELKLVAQVSNPSFIAIHPNRKYLYCVNENDEGKITSFSINSDDGTLTLINDMSSHGGDPCYLYIHDDYLMVTNYSGNKISRQGSVSCLKLADNGSLSEITDCFMTWGDANPLSNRQKCSHPHSIHKFREHFVVADLGYDRLFINEFDDGYFNDINSYDLQRGSGPRHMTSYNEKLYVINELNSTIMVVDRDLNKLQTISTLPDEYDYNKNLASEIVVHPSGRFLYAGNRGHNSIAIYNVLDDGLLQLVSHVESLGKTPRNFIIDPSGEYLIIGNQNSDLVVIYRIDINDGSLSFDNSFSVPSPTCLRIL